MWKVLLALTCIGCVSTGHSTTKEKIVVRVNNQTSWNSVDVTVLCAGIRRGFKIKNVSLANPVEQSFNAPCDPVQFVVTYFTTTMSWVSEVKSEFNVSKWCLDIFSNPNHNIVFPCGYL